ncbi:MAG TPA: aminoacyl-tRNA hydrolase [Phycisphaerales bacterium]|nr:aminoacyl-tRNA hydrolase [Phycisphaerales bacterium]
MAEIKMIVGLGNPGDEYVGTRHNVGFRVIDSLAEALKIRVGKKKFGACLGQGRFADKELILLKPWQFMNRSGQAVAAAMGFYRLGVSDGSTSLTTNLLVITDDMALSPGRIRIRRAGSAGGHKGLADVIETLGTENIGRLRIGIGRNDRIEAVDYVLGRPTKQEKPLLDEAIERSQKAVLCWVECGIETAMNEFNKVISDC